VVPERVPPFVGDVIETEGGRLSTVMVMGDELAVLLRSSVARA
jgi:hypothetical protein